MKVAFEVTTSDWQDYASTGAVRRSSWNSISWPFQVNPATGIFKSLFGAITSKVAASIAILRSNHAHWNPLSFAAMAYTTVLWATLIDLSSVTHLMPEPFLQGLEVAAVLWVIAARRALNRTPQRLSNQDGIADTGAFRFVRHPICAGRAMLYGAFWMSNFNIQNTLILLSVYAVQLFQILRGERLLMKVPAYRDYAAKVRHRLVYELF